MLTVIQSSVSIGDPHIVSDALGPRSIVSGIYEPLVRLDGEGRYQPGLAERWDVGEDARSWTFHLREGVTFHNGEVLSASDVVATMGRVLDPSIGGAFGTQGVYISYLGTAEISALDDMTVRLREAGGEADANACGEGLLRRIGGSLPLPLNTGLRCLQGDGIARICIPASI